MSPVLLWRRVVFFEREVVWPVNGISCPSLQCARGGEGGENESASKDHVPGLSDLSLRTGTKWYG